MLLDTDTITHGIQLAVAPVFLLTAVAGLIGAVAGRLARIIDRARLLEERAAAGQEASVLQKSVAELRELRSRGRLANGCIALLTSCAFLICLTIILLFLGETMGLTAGRWAVATFLGGVVCFGLAILCFLAETYIATRLLNFELLRKD